MTFKNLKRPGWFEPYEIAEITEYKDGVGCTDEDKKPIHKYAFFDRKMKKVY